ncbi:MAG: type VI secretion lipoprotein TssJ [Deltaproteobacteria bacterium]|jgi:predicted component of type VI protein secretion system|nr:type VI secretion lipoprotein TssJ [Deltaproteobacteria bacterium]
MKLFLTLITGLLSLSLTACGPKSANPEPLPPTPAETVETINWAYAPLAIRLGILADPILNEVIGGSTSLAVCLYQLSELSALTTLSQSREGLISLLTCAPTLAGAVSSDRLLVQPGQKMDLTLDRLEKTRYLAVVAGYQDLRPVSSVAYLPIPIEEDSHWLFFKRYQPQRLEAWLVLKSQTAQLFYKTPSDYGRLAKDLTVPEPKRGPDPKLPPKDLNPVVLKPDLFPTRTVGRAARIVPDPRKQSPDPNPLVFRPTAPR